MIGDDFPIQIVTDPLTEEWFDTYSHKVRTHLTTWQQKYNELNVEIFIANAGALSLTYYLDELLRQHKLEAYYQKIVDRLPEYVYESNIQVNISFTIPPYPEWCIID